MSNFINTNSVCTCPGENSPGESRKPAGNIGEGGPIDCPAGSFCLNLNSELSSPEFLSSSCGNPAGDSMAPASSWEKDLQSSPSEKKLETRVIGPGLKPKPCPVAPPPEVLKSVSKEVRGGRVIVGREGADGADDGGGSSCCSLSAIWSKPNQQQTKLAVSKPNQTTLFGFGLCGSEIQQKVHARERERRKSSLRFFWLGFCFCPLFFFFSLSELLLWIDIDVVCWCWWLTASIDLHLRIEMTMLPPKTFGNYVTSSKCKDGNALPKHTLIYWIFRCTLAPIMVQTCSAGDGIRLCPLP